MEDMREDTRITNQMYIRKKQECVEFIKSMNGVLEFIDNYAFLTFGRDFIYINKHMFSIKDILLSTELTVSNLIDCCKTSCFADANTLLRKYRDDLFFALYIIVYDKNNKTLNTSKKTKMGENVEKWLNNNLTDLNINDVLKEIGTSPCLAEAVSKYKLKMSFDDIGKRLNNYVHGNRYMFYNRNIIAYSDEQLFSCLNQINNDLHYITTAFLFLLILCSPLYIMSTDYQDYLDCGQEPPLDSQYFVAPFVQDFLRNNIILLGSDCYNYLKNNICMNLD